MSNAIARLQLISGHVAQFSIWSPVQSVPCASADVHQNTLVAGNTRYLGGSMLKKGGGDTNHRAQVAKGQAPKIAVVGCADSRVPVEVVFDADAGEIFTVRVAGNVINDDIVASIEYGVVHLGVEFVLVLGHTSCGAVAAAGASLNAKADPNAKKSYLPQLMEKIMPALATSPSDPVFANLAAQTKMLRERFKELNLNAPVKPAIFDLASGKVTFYD